MAIVSPIAGTTRDALETCLDVGGFPVVVVDTAGLREETADPIEREGIRRALDNAKSADLIIMGGNSIDIFCTVQPAYKGHGYKVNPLVWSIFGKSRPDLTFC